MDECKISSKTIAESRVDAITKETIYSSRQVKVSLYGLTVTSWWQCDCDTDRVLVAVEESIQLRVLKRYVVVDLRTGTFNKHLTNNIFTTRKIPPVIMAGQMSAAGKVSDFITDEDWGQMND